MAWSEKAPRPKSLEFLRNVPLVKARDKFMCQIFGPGCLVNQKLEVDHITPWAEGGSDSMDNLQTVCEVCHKPKTHEESRRSYRRNRERAKHPWTRIGHPGLSE